MKNIVKENGFLVADYDEDGLYEAMKILSKDSTLRARMGEQSFLIANSFSSELMSAKYTIIYKKNLQ